MTTHVVLYQGTHGGAWAKDPLSPFRQRLREKRLSVTVFEGWSMDVDGVPSLWSAGKHADWIAGGHAGYYLLKTLPYEARNLIAHSHGVNPILYTCKLHQLPIRRLITVCSPVRDDMQAIADAAKPHIGRWRHICSSRGDPWQRAGELFDGHFTWPFSKAARQWRQADENLSIPAIGHSKLLNDPTFLDLWQTDGMFDFLRATEVVGV
jgi:hypothetical protein